MVHGSVLCVTLVRVYVQVVGSSVAGQPVVHVSGVIVVLLLATVPLWVEPFVTVAHEGGHIVVSILTGRYDGAFHVEQNSFGGATQADVSWGVGGILSALAGYLTPPLVGLGGAVLVLEGRSWSVLWASVLLLLGALFQAKDLYTGLIVVLAGGGIGWAATAAPPEVQAGLAVGLVWLMLLGGITTMRGQRFGGDPRTDAGQLARLTWIPAFLWVALFWFVAIVCLWVGGRRLLAV